MTPNPTYVALIAKDDDGYVLASDHPTLGVIHWPELASLERSTRRAVLRLPDTIELRFGPGVEPSLTDEAALEADNPTAAYKTVPGTERLPATDRVDRGDGLGFQEDEPATGTLRDRHRDRMRVIALGQVHAPGAQH